MFRISITNPILNLDGTVAQLSGQIMTLRQIIVAAANSLAEEDQKTSPQERLYRMAIARAAMSSDTLDLTLADVLALTPLIARLYAHPLVVETFIKACENSVIPKPPATTVEDQSKNPGAAE